jgi:hypothetical protein
MATIRKVQNPLNRPRCDQLDDYLLGWLTADEAATFKRHLADCPACRREQALQQTIDVRLVKIREWPDAIPSGLVERTRKGIRSARRRRALRWAEGLAAAAAVGLAAILGRLRPQDFGRPEAQDVSALPPQAPAIAVKQLTVSSRVKLADPSAGIVVEYKTRDPNISMVWIYPILKPPAPAGGGPINSIFTPNKEGERL